MHLIRKHICKILSRLLLLANLIVIALLLLSAYGGNIPPRIFSWHSSLALIFPFLVVACVLFMVMWLIVQSRKWVWNFFALIVCIYPLRTYCPVNWPQDIPDGSIKVVSYNTYGLGCGIKDTVLREQMIEYLRLSDADMLCAQESGYNLSRKKAVEEAVEHWPYRDTVNVGQYINSLAFFSNYPILDRHIIHSSSKGHVCVVYNVKIEDDTVLVINSHFVSNAISPDDKATYQKIVTISDRDSTREDILRLGRKVNYAGLRRAEQADSLYLFLKQVGDRPVVVCGDFNESPLSYVHTRLCGLLDDAYTASGNGPGISYHLNRMYFRLDNILCSRHWRAYAAKVDSRQKMSDHYPIEVWLKRRKEQP
ncbi:MAG: endonuclease/exonuclease/phosphatase family protein [Prevotellaceae bacterium]|nr:endonuclease/exonuclease/phosphatase family protein [Prevotellaceae bacterium]